jgi:hypothetical protein
MDQADEQQPPAPKTSERKPYERPRIAESGRYEHLVLQCAKATATGMCLAKQQSIQ